MNYTCSRTAANRASLVPGGDTLLVSLDSLTSTWVGHDRAFAVVESAEFSDDPGISFYLDALYVTAGTNVYEIWELSGVDAQSPLMPELISRVQALYARG